MHVEDCYELGFVLRAHGIKGEVKVRFDVQDIREYHDLESVYLLQGGKLIPFYVDEIRFTNNSEAIVQFKRTGSREDAEALKGAKLMLPLEILPELEGNHFYYHEIAGFVVQDENLGKLGRVIRVMEMPAQDLVAMLYKGREVLIPLSDDVVLHPDREAKVLHTRLPEGLLDIYLD